MSPKALPREATGEELARGADEILEAHIRMQSQLQESEELPIEDKKHGKSKVATGSKQSTEGGH